MPRLLKWGLPVTLSLCLWLPQVACAQENRRGVDVEPSKTELHLEPGQIWSGVIKIAFDVSSPIQVSAKAMDFTATGDEAGAPKFYLPKSDDPGSLSRWMELSQNSQVAQPNVFISVPVTIRVPANAAPGGHYGAVMFANAPRDAASGLQGSQINLQVASIFLVTVSGQLNEKMAVAEFYGQQDIYETAPWQFTLRLNNTGNTHLAPDGVLEIFNEFGTLVQSVPISGEGYVLPKSVRKFVLGLGSRTNLVNVAGFKIPMSQPLAFGMYHAKLTMWYGARQTALVAEDTVWVFPWRLLSALTVIFFVVFLGLRFLVHRYRLEVIVRRMLHR